MEDLARPYVPRLVLDWLRDQPGARSRRVDGTLVFADVSGFTALTERLAQRGKIGAEEMGDLLNVVFERLLTDAYDYGAALLKWGGDAALLLFDGDDHAVRACRAAWEMQRTIKRMGGLRTSVGNVTLRMSVGVHSGPIDVFLVGGDHRELIVTGPAATATAAMEQAAAAGEVLVSDSTAARLPPGSVTGQLLTRPPKAVMQPARSDRRRDSGLAKLALPVEVADHLLSGAVEPEHRQVVTAFVEFSGTDELAASGRFDDLADALTAIIDSATEAARSHGVTFLATDIAPNGGKVILAAGVPQARGDSEQRMLAAVRDILDRPLALATRAGVNRGRVFAGDYGPPYRRTYSVVGDSVNLAARLMGKAQRGELLTTPEVLESASVLFPYEELAPLTVKGKSAPVAAVRVIGGAVETRAAAPALLPFAGRDDELASLNDRLERCRRGSGSAVEIVGDRGIGKSRLVDEFCATVAEPVHRAVCDVYGESMPYAAVRRLLRSALGIESTADPASAARRLRRLAPSDLLPLLPLLNPVIGADLPRTEAVKDLGEEFQVDRLAATVTGLLAAVVTSPTVLVVEDTHFGDTASADLLRAIGAVAGPHPWLLVVTRRPDGRPVCGEEIALAPLDHATAVGLLEAATESAPIAHRELSVLRDKAGGNPLFLQELVMARLRLGAVEAVPDSVEAVVAAEIDVLDPASRAVLRAAAVLGVQCDRRVLEAVLAGEVVSAVVARFLTIRGDVVQFRHALAREVAYETLPYQRRRRIHEQAATAIESILGDGDDQVGVLSVHHAAAGHWDAALALSRRAGEIARAGFAPVDAARYFGRALECAQRAGADDQMGAIGQVAGEAWLMIGEMPKAEAAFRLASKHAVSASDAVEAKAWLADVCIRTGRHQQALRWLSRGLRETADEAGRAALDAALITKYAFVRWQQGRLKDAARLSQRAVETALVGDSPKALARAYQVHDLVRLTVGDLHGRAFGKEALAIFEELGLLAPQAYLLNQVGMRAYYLGEWDAALEHYDKARSILLRIGDDVRAIDTALNISEIRLDQGRLAESEEGTRQVLRQYRAAGARQRVGYSLSQLGIIEARQGRTDDALESLAAARELSAADSDSLAVAVADARRAETLLIAGRTAEAVDLIAHVLAHGGEAAQAIEPQLVRLRATATGDPIDVERAVEVARARGTALDLAVTLDVAAHLGGDPQERDALFAQLGIVSAPPLSLPAARA